MSEKWRKSNERCIVTGEGGNIEVVAQVSPAIRNGYISPVVVHERMNLIAAAPEMLEALEMLLMVVEREANWPPDHACAECRPNSEIIVDGFKCGRHAAIAAIAKAKGE